MLPATEIASSGYCLTIVNPVTWCICPWITTDPRRTVAGKVLRFLFRKGNDQEDSSVDLVMGKSCSMVEWLAGTGEPIVTGTATAWQ